MPTELPFSPPDLLPGNAPLLLVCDHASHAVPPGYGDLGLTPAQLRQHVGWDIGAAALTRDLARRLDAPAILAPWSRLLIDVNRPLDHPGLIAEISDGIVIPGNRGIDATERMRRIERVYQPFHAAVAAQIAMMDQPVVVSVHSFTPRMDGFDRPWQVGILWNEDERLARRLIDRLDRHDHLTVGDNEPYSGKLLYHTLANHAEARGLHNAGLEIRQDEIADDAGVARWGELLADALKEVLS